VYVCVCVGQIIRSIDYEIFVCLLVLEFLKVGQMTFTEGRDTGVW
jgi:hypothetical protein